MKKVLVVLCVALGVFAFQTQAEAQCGPTQLEMELHNQTNCSIDFSVDFNTAGNVSVTVPANTTHKQCYASSDYAISINVSVTGGGSATLDGTNADDYDDLCAGAAPQTTFHAAGHGWSANTAVTCTVTEQP